eukprot:81846-Pelagomonas_calceolata.AAC.1
MASVRSSEIWPTCAVKGANRLAHILLRPNWVPPPEASEWTCKCLKGGSCHMSHVCAVLYAFCTGLCSLGSAYRQVKWARLHKKGIFGGSNSHLGLLRVVWSQNAPPVQSKEEALSSRDGCPEQSLMQA